MILNFIMRTSTAKHRLSIPRHKTRTPPNQQTSKHIIPTGRQTDGQTDRQTDRQTEGHAAKPRDRTAMKDHARPDHADLT